MNKKTETDKRGGGRRGRNTNKKPQRTDKAGREKNKGRRQEENEMKKMKKGQNEKPRLRCRNKPKQETWKSIKQQKI